MNMDIHITVQQFVAITQLQYTHKTEIEQKQKECQVSEHFHTCTCIYQTSAKLHKHPYRRRTV